MDLKIQKSPFDMVIVLSSGGCQAQVDQLRTYLPIHCSYQYGGDGQSGVEEGVRHVEGWKRSLHRQSIFRVPQANLQSAHAHTNRSVS